MSSEVIKNVVNVAASGLKLPESIVSEGAEKISNCQVARCLFSCIELDYQNKFASRGKVDSFSLTDERLKKR